MSKDKPGMDFDFSDIAGGTTKVEGAAAKLPAEPQKKKAKTKKTEKDKTTGIILTVEADGHGQYRTLDLGECTGEQFVEWAKLVYPVEDLKPEIYESRSNRIRAFKEIAQFHQNALMLSKSNPDKLEH